MAEYVPVYTKRERRFRNLGKILFLASVVLVVVLILSIKVSLMDNELNFEWVEFQNNEGDDLSGLLLVPKDIPDGGAPAVIITHDLTGHKEQLNRISLELARQGFIVLAVDMRDHGRSHGKTTFGNYNGGEPYDLTAAYDYLVKDVDYVDINRIAIVGDGFGGAMALMANNILADRNVTLAAVVAWAPPMDLTELFNENKDNVERYLDRRIAEWDWGYVDDRDNRSARLHIDSENWVKGNVYIIYGQTDDLVPKEQFLSLHTNAELYEVANVGHDLSESEEVLKFTIDFLNRKLDKTPRVEIDFNYKEVEAINKVFHACSLVVFVFAFFMLYEASVIEKTNRSYIPQFSKDIKPMFLGLAVLIDIVVYVGIAWSMNGLYNRIQDGLFMDILPATQFFTTALVTGAIMIIFAIAVWYTWSNWMHRDEERSDETCGNLRGILLGALAIVVILINYFFGQVLLFGPLYPKDVTFVLVVGIIFLLFLGHELWVRKLIQPKIQGLMQNMFLRHRWPYQLTFFGIMYGIYCLLALVLLWNLGRDHFGPDFGLVYGLFVTAIGLVATIIYHRSNSILASTTYSSIMGSWLLVLVYHL
jgi:dienelactone hydrolase